MTRILYGPPRAALTTGATLPALLMLAALGVAGAGACTGEADDAESGRTRGSGADAAPAAAAGESDSPAQAVATDRSAPGPDRSAPGPGGADNPVHWSAALAETSQGEGDAPLAPGDFFSVSVRAAIDPGWYIYSITQGEGGPVPSRISLAADQPFTQAGDVAGPTPAIKFDQNFSIQVEMHVGAVAYDLPVQVSADAGPDADHVQVRARYQACTDRLCLPAQTERILVPVRVAAPAAAGPDSHALASPFAAPAAAGPGGHPLAAPVAMPARIRPRIASGPTGDGAS